MSYPNIGMRGLLEGDPKWDAELVEKLLRGAGDYGPQGVGKTGIHIYFEDPGDTRGRAMFKDGKFQYLAEDDDNKKPVFESESFLEFAVWCAFMGRDFL